MFICLKKRETISSLLNEQFLSLGNEINPEEVIQNVKLNLQNIKAIKIQR